MSTRKKKKRKVLTNLLKNIPVGALVVDVGASVAGAKTKWMQ